MKTLPSQYTFPLVVGDHGELEEVNHGLTKREYFAAIALQGMYTIDMHTDLLPSEAASLAVEYADALIEALNDDT